MHILFKIIKRFCFCFLILLPIINYSNNYIIFPFNSTHISLKLDENLDKFNSAESLLVEINKNQLYVTISMGNPPRNIEFYLTMDNTIYGILSGYCPIGSFSLYNPYLSKNFKSLTDYEISLGSILNAAIAEDSCALFNDISLSKVKYIDNFEFLLGNYTFSSEKIPDKYCGMVGLYKSSSNAYAYAKNFINFLKEEKIIDSYSWGIFFFDKEQSYNFEETIKNKYDGFYIAGITDEDYLNIFKTKNIINTNSIENNINFKVFFYDDKNKTEIICSQNSLAYFIVDFNYIVSEKEYYEGIVKFFFQKYIDDKICVHKSSFRVYEGKTQMIVCDSSFKKYLKYFPSIYFYSRELSFTFNLDYNDLFLEEKNKIYFLIAYKDMIQPIWKIGKIFMKKYPLIFDQDKKTISLVYLNKFKKNEDDAKKTSNFFKRFKDYLLYCLLFIGILIGLLIGRRIWNRHRKLKANELEENYQYLEHETSKIGI